MRKSNLTSARAKLSSIVTAAAAGRPTVICRRGAPEAIIVGYREWQRLSRVPSFGRLLMSAPFEPGDIPPRAKGDWRPVKLTR
ncbi:MAG: type II toxin-antitoxin system Phd/YefM family antitoxin [Alphaproteobacteria bacterium]|nr:type II toxin-antitoxin system Phd/YefM family antitoxin [Alphaproteobacteria bacterium]